MVSVVEALEPKKSTVGSLGPLAVSRKLTDAVLFIGFIGVTVLALATVTVATPIILVLSAILGLFQSEQARKNWQPVPAKISRR